MLFIILIIQLIAYSIEFNDSLLRAKMIQYKNLLGFYI